MTAVDQINDDLGSGTVRFAQEGFDHRWGIWFEATSREPCFYSPNFSRNWDTRFEFKSPRYTTRWNELPVARAC
jgi:hypothetical protein